MDEGTTAAIERLEGRVRALEDQIALYQAWSTYGPALDGGCNEDAAALWTEDGIFDTDGPAPEMNDRSQILAMFNDWEVHLSLEANGCGHVSTLPLLKVDGDKAVGLGYFRLYLHGPDGFGVWRLSAIRWDWVREGDGWRAVKQTKRVLDGSEGGRALMRDTLNEIRVAGPSTRGAD